MGQDVKKYCIWNNKGGVGKTFITYSLATEYAKNNPDKEIIVVDMCPQANLSEIVLGGNGKGQNNIEELHNLRLTVASYIISRYNNGNKRTGSEISYFHQASLYNSNIPANMYLVCGDIDLDLCSSLINHLATAPRLTAWRDSRLILKDLIDVFSEKPASSKKEQVYFIDCNPSFANYTEMSLLASNRLIIPCTADNASIRGLTNVFKLLYTPIDPNDELFLNFKSEVGRNNLDLPKVYNVVLNKSRSHQTNPAKAFRGIQSALEAQINEFRQLVPNNFSPQYSDVKNIKDGNTCATVVNHTGILVSDIVAKQYQVYDRKATVNQSQIDTLIEHINLVVQSI